jgi:glutaconate CoA-transferase subunit B
MSSTAEWTAEEMMTVAAARALEDGTVCFVGIGLPSTAANLACRLHAPDLVLVYESGTLGAKPDFLPLSIGDGNLAETADAVVSASSRPSTTGCRRGASTSASSPGRSSTASRTSTRP